MVCLKLFFNSPFTNQRYPGDRADRKGALTGGFMDNKHSRLEAAKNFKKWQSKIDEESLRLQTVKNEIQRCDQEITMARDRLQSLERQCKETIESHGPLSRQLSEKSVQKSDLSKSIIEKVGSILFVRCLKYLPATL